jgi:hypothetical protein
MPGALRDFKFKMNTRRASIHILSTALFALIASATWPAQAQDAAAPPAGTPVPAPLTGDFTLTKKFSYLTPPDAPHLTADQQAAQNFLHPAATKIVQSEIVAKGGLRRDVNQNSDGSTVTIWRVQTYRFTVYSAHPQGVIVNQVAGTDDPHAPNQYRDGADFAELSWITPAAFSGRQTQQGKQCYIYKVGDQTAYVDVSTRLPIYFQSKTVQVTYTYSPPPDDPLQFPAGYPEKLDKFQRALRGQF